MLRRLSCLFSAFAVLFFCSVPAFATGMEMGGGGVGIPIVGNINLDVVDFMDYCRDDLRWCGNFALKFLNDDVCTYAPQLGGGHNFIPRRTMKDGQVGLYYVCEYCGKAYGEALEKAYQEYVETLPGKQYNSSGAYLWVPGVSDFKLSSQFTARLGNSNKWDVCSFTSLTESTPFNNNTDAAAIPYIGSYVLLYLGPSFYTKGYMASWGSIVAPVTGFYTSAEGAPGSVRNLFYSAGTAIGLSSSGSCDLLSGRYVTCPWPAFWIRPYDGGGSTYALDTRVSGPVPDGGAFGYVQDGQLFQSTVGSIYNETTNVYQNPVTGETSDVSSWNYDYSDRSYALTTDESETITLTYGDSAVTINEGGTTYNVYYLMEEAEDVQEALESYCDHDYASTVTTAPTCTASGVRTYTCSKCGTSYTQTVPPTGHNYQSAVTMAPTCVNTGVRTFTCSECGDSYAVSIAATGHTWETVRSVPTTYDNDTGQLVQQGYTLYECSVCHEQYRIDADSGGSSLPAPSSGGTSTGTDLSVEIDSSVGKGFLATIAHGLTEDLPAAIQAASSWFTSLPSLYEGYIGFMSASVSWLPSDIQVLLRFAVGFTTFVGIIRRIWGQG